MARGAITMIAFHMVESIFICLASFQGDELGHLIGIVQKNTCLSYNRPVG